MSAVLALSMAIVGAADGAAVQAHIAEDGAVWLPAEEYASALGGYVELAEDGLTALLCIDDVCVPLIVGDGAANIDDVLHLRVDHVARALHPSDEAGPGAGGVAPEFTLSSLDGEPVSLSDYLGKKLLVFAWASW